jgi:hypothetical protein
MEAVCPSETLVPIYQARAQCFDSEDCNMVSYRVFLYPYHFYIHTLLFYIEDGGSSLYRNIGKICQTTQNHIIENFVISVKIYHHHHHHSAVPWLRLPTEAVRVRTQVRSCGPISFRVFRVPLPVFIPPTAPYTLTIVSDAIHY